MSYRCFPVAALLLVAIVSHASSQTVRLKDGRFLSGRMAKISGVADNPMFGESDDSAPESLPILLIDDELRRTFVSKHAVAEVIDQMPEPLVKIRLPWHDVARQGSTVGSVGPSLGITPFDAWGRRIYEMQTRDGPLAVVQGITELTPRYTKVESLRGPPRTIVWDYRMATSSIPPDVLAQILEKAVSRDDPNHWLQVVTFYMQSERYREAHRELQAIIGRFPELKHHATEGRQLRQLSARSILDEIALRRSAGQHQLARLLLEQYPADEVAGETLQQVRELSAAYEAEESRLTTVRHQLQEIVSQIADPDHQRLAKPLAEEIVRELSHNTLPRLAPFEQLVDDPSFRAEQRVSLAITGWLLGAERATEELAVALSLAEARTKVRSYLKESLSRNRIEILQSMRSLEGASIENIARLIAHMAPPREIAEGAKLGQGAYELTAPGHSENGNFRYLVQLPPEYDRLHHYPTLVVLNGAYNSPRQELEFWAGGQPKDDAGKPIGPRRGQAMRRGYIVIAVDWQKPHQQRYEHSLREHEAVLASVRDACRHFGIDTDRVYLSGHGIGGDAAWDFAQGHPDLWAGVIPFVAKMDRRNKYVQHYWENARYVPLYFVAGEKDGQKMSANASVLDKYFRKRFDVTVVEYLGRGQEPFHDEILKIFEWIELPTHRRNSSIKEFQCKTMRSWDNFFWWIEGVGFDNLVHPGIWPKRKARPTLVEGRVGKENHLKARIAAERATIWLSPELVDFSKPVHVTVNGKRIVRERGTGEPDLAVLLEDVRTRADRLRPFWAKLEWP